jgi:hypothetical protein
MSQPAQPAAEPALDQDSVAFLTQEIDRLQTFYLDAISSAQSVFNFYLTFVSTVVGALVIIIQLVPSTDVDVLRSQLVLSGLLLFAAIVGVVYLSSLSGKYGHAARYARAVDDLRRYLIDRLQVPLPNIYDRFTENPSVATSEKTSWWVWIMPTGTYELFISIMNSAALAGLTWFIADLGGADLGRRLLAIIVVFVLSLQIHNAYSRLTIHVFANRFHVRLDMGKELSFWAARE